MTILYQCVAHFPVVAHTQHSTVLSIGNIRVADKSVKIQSITVEGRCPCAMQFQTQPQFQTSTLDKV